MQVKNYTLPIPRASGTVSPVLPTLPATGPQTDSAQAQLQAWRFKFVTRFRFASFCICRVQQAVIAFRGRVAGANAEGSGNSAAMSPPFANLVQAYSEVPRTACESPHGKATQSVQNIGGQFV